MFDLEMLEEIGFCHGIENYSRHLTGRAPGRAAADAARLPARGLPALHRRVPRQTVPQIGGMYRGDRSRKETLVEYGFRLPSALDNRPLQLRGVRGAHGPDASTSRRRPGPYELEQTQGRVRRAGHPADRPHRSRRSRCARSRARSTTCSARSATASRASERVLVTTLTKRMAEDLTEYYRELGVRVRYLHSDIDTLERIADPARPAPGRVRRAGRDQPAARGARPARGVAGRHPRRRQGRLPALGALADPDHRPRRAQRQRPGHPLRRHGHRLDALGDRRDRRGGARSSARTTRSTASRPESS